MRVYRALLRLYPRRFRERYERELCGAFAADRAEPRYRGAAGAFRFWLHILFDVAVSVVRVRTATRPTSAFRRPSRRSAMEALLQDFRHAARGLVRRPGFAGVAVLSLALAIGGNATIYGIVDGFVLNPFPYPDADRVVGIGVTFPRLSSEETFIEALSPAEFLDIRKARTIRDIACFDLGNRNISGGDRPERVFTGLALTDPFLPFGLRPALGRGFTAEELGPNGPSAAVLSYRIWQSRFGGDRGIVGRAIRVNGSPATVVGVMPPELLILGADLWIPWGADPLVMPRNVRQFTLIGRLAPGATADEANAELAALAAAVAQAHDGQFKEYDGWRLTATPWAEALMRNARPAAFLLLGAVGLVLVIACANLSNLLLARATTRHREIAVRLALGAGRWRVARHVLVETALLAALGAGLGLLVARAGVDAAKGLLPSQIASLGLTASINQRVLAWTILFTIGSTLLAALLPVLQSTRTEPHDSLKTEGRGATAGRRALALRHGLIVAEIALSVVLLAGAGLLTRSFVNLRQVEPGFDPHNVLTMRLTLPPERYRGAAINDFFQQVIDRVEQAPGVRAASATSQFPPFGPFTMQFRLAGREQPGDTLPTAMTTVTSAGHFAALGVPAVAGRGFTNRDRSGAPPVAVVNRAFVARFLPGANPIGQRVVLGSPDRPRGEMEIVGVVADTRNQGLTLPPAPEVFVPMHQQTINNQLFLIVRTETDAAAMLPLVRRQIAAIDPDQPIYAIQTLDEAFASATFQQRLSTILLGLFAAVALLLAAIGIYGVMSYAVSARTQEIGVRLAMGARRKDVLWLVLSQVRLTTAGLVIGIGLLVAGGGALRRVLFEVRPWDPATIAAVATVLGSVALFAGWLPAWRASRVDPVDALRYE